VGPLAGIASFCEHYLGEDGGGVEEYPPGVVPKPGVLCMGTIFLRGGEVGNAFSSFLLRKWRECNGDASCPGSETEFVYFLDCSGSTG